LPQTKALNKAQSTTSSKE